MGVTALRRLPRFRLADQAAFPASAEDAWPHTSRLLPWSIAGFLCLVWFVPIDSVTLPVPLPVDPTIDRFALGLIVVLWLGALTIRDAALRPRFRSSLLDPMVALFVAVALASVLVQLPTLVAVGEFELALKKLLILGSVALFFYIVATSLRPGELQAFSVLIVVLAAFTSLGVIYEYRTEVNLFFDWTRSLLPGAIEVGAQAEDPKFGRELVTGPTSHGIAIATMMAMALPFAFTGYLRTRIAGDKLLYAIAMGLILAACFSTVRRTGAVAPAAALLVLLLYRPGRMLKLLPLGLVLVIGIQVAAPSAISRVKAQIFGGSFLSDKSAEGRTDDYGPVQVDIVDKLALGRGFGSYDPSRYRFLDNEYLGRLVETGVIGLVVYLLLILSVVRIAHRAGRSRDAVRASVGVAVVAGIAAYATANGVFDALAFPQVPYMFFFLAAIAVVAASPQHDVESQSHAVEQGGRPPDEGGGAPQTSASPSRAGREAVYDLTVIVVTHNGRSKALATLASAKRHVHDISTQWLVVDSGSTDGTPEAIERQHPELSICRLPNVGFAAANNVALRRAHGRYVLLLNPDVEIRRGALDDLVLALDERPEVGAASVIQRSSGGTILPSVGYFPTMTRQFAEALCLSRIPGVHGCDEMEKRLDRYYREHSADWVVGAFLIVRADVIAAVGGLDERFFLYSEEKDWCYRIRQSGWDIRHLPLIDILHHTGGYGRPELRAQLTQSKLLFARKHFGAMRREGIRAGLVLRHMLRLVAFRVRHRGAGSRSDAERYALAVALGRAKGPFE